MHFSTETWEFARILSFVQRPNIRTRAILRHSLRRSVVRLGKDKQAMNMNSCQVGIHVRHGDSSNDPARKARQVDRSFEAHVTCAKQLLDALGVGKSSSGDSLSPPPQPPVLFLATDNATLFSLAPNVHSAFHWAGQARALQVFTGKTSNHHNEKVKHQEIANLMTDLILMSRCETLVLSPDSGFSNLFLQTACSRNMQGDCPLTMRINC